MKSSRAKGKSVISSYLSELDTLARISFFPVSADAAQMQKEFISALAPSPEAIEKAGQYFYKKTAELISVASCSLGGANTKSVDIVRDVLKLVPIYWAASEIVRILILNIVRLFSHD